MVIPTHPFAVAWEDRLLQGDRTSGDFREPILFLHGAGASTRRQFDPLRQRLWEEKRPSAAFDFVGHGETKGCLALSSLRQRFLQACQVIEALSLSQPLTLVAESMSGYTAIQLLEKYAVEALILFVPAVYCIESYELVFSQGFSAAIRKPKSWLNTDAWEIIGRFQGKLLICWAECDAVIPQEIIERLYEAARGAEKKELYCIQGSPHKTWEYLAENREAREKMLNQVLAFLKM